MSRTRSGVVALATAGLVAALAPVGASASNVEVDVFDYGYDPEALEVPAGTTVVWRNSGEEAHSVTATNGSFDSGLFGSGQTYSRTFEAATTIRYYCTLHGAAVMEGTLTVTGDGGGGTPTQPQARDIADACDGRSEDGFTDVPPDNAHEAAIDCVVARWGIASGKSSTTYAPSEQVTRAQMATFIAKTMEAANYTFPSNPPDAFTDDAGSPHEDNINKLAAAKVVGGTGGTSYSPAKAVTRGQMATFLVKAYETAAATTLPAGEDYFADDDGTVHEDNTNKAARVGFAGGYPDGTYRPAATVKRDAMASFIARVLDALVEAGKATPPPS